MNRVRVIRWLFVLALMLGVPAASHAGIFFSVSFGPPALPIYAQPICPGPGYIWTPGYWAYGDAGYFWVPGTWVFAPFQGALWTPGYWGWGGSAYLWHAGYWGTSVGFYGGINYGYGYGGYGYDGGYWNRGNFYYNRAASNIRSGNFRYVYDRAVVNRGNRISYNGGAGGLTYRANAAQENAYRSRRQEALPAQLSHREEASRNRAMFANVNRGAPSIAATERPGAFSGRGVSRATQAGAPYRPPEARPSNSGRPSSAAGGHWNQPSNRPPNTMSRPESRPEMSRPSTARPATPSREMNPYRGEQPRSMPAHRAAPEQRREPVQRMSAPQRAERPQAAPRGGEGSPRGERGGGGGDRRR